MPELCAPLGLDGLRMLPEWHAIRRHNALRLAQHLGGLPGLRIPLPPAHTEHAFYRLYAYVIPEQLASGWDRDRITRAVAAEGVPAQYGSCAEIYRERAFTNAGFSPATRLPVAAELHDTSIAFLVHPTLGDTEVDDTIAAVTKVMEVACR
jgi:dTDP-4-amino-4,6-dideoxygalactose transaminase